MIKILLLTILTLVTSDIHAQLSRSKIKRNNRKMATYQGNKSSFTPKRYNALSITLNSLNYFGDLSPTASSLSTDIKLTKPAFGIGFTRRMGPRYSLQGNFTCGTIQGSDFKSADEQDLENSLYRYQRNLSFRNRIQELSVVAVFDLFQNLSMYTQRAAWTPFIFAGVAVYHHNPQARVPENDQSGNPFSNAGDWVDLQPLGTEGQYLSLHESDANFGTRPYKRIQPAIPLGIGVRFRINYQIDLSVEFSMRYLFTDYIDDVSKNYTDLGAFGDNELARALSYRSNERKTPGHSYVSSYDQKTYQVILGYGEEGHGNIRGNKGDRDMITVLAFRFSYLPGASMHHAKSR